MGSDEYRVVWQRDGMRRPKWRRYQRREAAERFVRILTSPEPWKEWGDNGDDYFCCMGSIEGGYPCSCKGVTVREEALRKRADMPALRFVRLEKRQVERWNVARYVVTPNQTPEGGE